MLAVSWQTQQARTSVKHHSVPTFRLHLQYAAMLTGWSPGEKDLLRHGMARFGDRADLIQKFLLPTKTVDSIRSYVKVCCRPKSVLPGDSEQGTQRCEHAQDWPKAPAWTFPATITEPMC